MKQRVLVVYGTRPEAIKMAPVVRELRRRARSFDLTLCSTGQHREMLDQVERLFGLEPDHDLELMRPNQRLNELAASTLTALDGLLSDLRPDWLLTQGDTTTAMAASVAAFHLGIRVGHVEAGLRTGDPARPFPEEANRSIIDLVSDLLFAPTARARDLLLCSGFAADKVHQTGNTVIDALQWVSRRLPAAAAADEVLVTVHRRESFGAPIREIFAALAELAARFTEVTWVYPVHRNPNVSEPARELLGGRANVELLEPLPYDRLVQHLRRARLVLTDSGGIQEEAPTFGKPVLVLRETTERPEGVEAGVARLVGVERERIVSETSRLLTDDDAYRRMANAVNPYGDGHAAERIVDILAERAAVSASGAGQAR